jgi:hypothetical protein
VGRLADPRGILQRIRRAATRWLSMLRMLYAAAGDHSASAGLATRRADTATRDLGPRYVPQAVVIGTFGRRKDPAMMNHAAVAALLTALWVASAGLVANKAAGAGSPQGVQPGPARADGPREEDERVERVAQLDGRWLDWMNEAFHQLTLLKIEPEGRYLTLYEGAQTVVVTITRRARPGMVRGSSGVPPDIEIHIDKRTAKMTRWNFMR